MAKPYTHALSSARKWGGVAEDYLEIHQFMDSSKAAFPDNRHRCLTHNSWFLSVVLERAFGVNLTNSEGKRVSVREIGEQHCLEDYGGFIPTPQDFLEGMEYHQWMNAKGSPPSHRRIAESESELSVREITFD